MKYNVSDIIDYNVISAFQRFGTITFILTIIIEIFYGVIVFLTTTKKVQFFRILTCIFICECIFVEFVMLCWKPIRLFPSKVFYPTGILAPMSSTLSITFASFYLMGHACFIEIFTIIVVERHFRIVGNPIRIKNARFWIYFLMAILFISGVIAYFNIVLENIDDRKVQNILKSEILGIQQILDLQPSLFLLDFSINAESLIFVIIIVIYALYRVAIFAVILKDNYKYVQNAEINVSQITQKQFALMFHSTMIQFLTTLFFASVGLIWLLTYFFDVNNIAIKYVHYIALAVIMCYPIIDAILVVVVVKGYRNTVKKMFQHVKEKTNEKIQSFRFRTNNSVGSENIKTVTPARRRSFFVY